MRSIENSNKAQILRPSLYEKYADDTNLSFFFSDNPDDERNDLEIFEIIAKKKVVSILYLIKKYKN